VLTPGTPRRAVCASCRRPVSVCYCGHVRPIATKTRIVILQHPRERDVAIGTARMASLCLPGSELHVGVHWRGSRALAQALSDPARPAALLYPGPGAIDILRHPPTGPVTLVVVDGTWWQAKKVVRDNPDLAALPRYSFTPPAPSQYRIRREPEPNYVSTIEALVYVLGALEREPARFHALLEPFRAMIDAQLACEARHRSEGSRHPRRPRPPRASPRLPEILRDRLGDVVCVHGEANAWPYGSRERAEHDEELVHWVAQRLVTGETLDVVLAPRQPLAPSTPVHTGLSGEIFAAGRTAEDLGTLWRSFSRDTDVVCAWGHYATGLFEKLGISLPQQRLDLRHVARVYARGKVGTLDDLIARLGAAWSPPEAAGRAQLRLAQMTAIARHLHLEAQTTSVSTCSPQTPRSTPAISPTVAIAFTAAST
jgi:DTW domain-containing protein YfiP